MTHSGNSVCGEYGSTPYDEMEFTPFTKEITDEFEIKTFNTLFTFNVTFELRRDKDGDEEHTVLSINHIWDIADNGDECSLEKAFLAGVGGIDLDMKIQKFHYDRYDRLSGM